MVLTLAGIAATSLSAQKGLYLDKAGLLAVGVEVVNGFFNRFAGAAHRDDDMLGVGRAVVVEELVVCADLGVDLVHILLDDFGQGVVEFVPGLLGLEEDIRVLGRAALYGVVGVQRIGAEAVDVAPVDELRQILVAPHGDLVILVGGAESVEEVQERDSGLEGGQMRDSAEVHNLLYA